MRHTALLLAAALVVMFGLNACGDDVTEPTPEITSVTVTPSTVGVVAGETTEVTAEVGTANGVQGVTLEWSSSSPGVATVEPSGERTATVTGVSAGSAEITATATATNVDGSTSGTAGVQVQEPATIEQMAIRDESGQPIEGPVSGEISVSLQIDPGDQEVARVLLLVDDSVVASKELDAEESAGRATAAALAGTGGQVQEVQLDFNTADFDEETGEVTWTNGEYTLEASLETVEGSTVSASSSTTLSFDNENVLMVDHVDEGGGAVSGGVRWWGGENIKVTVTPVIFDGGTTVGSVTIDASAGTQTEGGGGSIDFDDPTATAEPFIFDILEEDNAGQVEDAPGEPDGPGGNGSEVRVEEVLNEAGESILDAFSINPLVDLFLDYVGPSAGPDAAVTAGGSEIEPETFYTAGPLSVRDVSDGGSGLGEDAFTFEVVPQNDDPPIETDDFDDLPEGPVGHFQPRVVEWGDVVGNPGDPTSIPDPPPVGIDQTGPNIEPPSSSDDVLVTTDEEGNILRITDFLVHFPDDPHGSGVNTANCTENCDRIRAEVLSGPDGAPGTFVVRTAGPSLPGAYSGTISVWYDPGGHDPFIFGAGRDGEPLGLDISLDSDGNLDIRGSSPWVDVSGTRQDDGTATASGSGTVAGNSNIRVEFDGDLTLENGLSGIYEMGSNGGLPGAYPIQYQIELTKGGSSQAAAAGDDFLMVVPSDAPDGTYTVEVEARDRALPDGNVSTVEFEIEVDRSSSN